MPVLHISRLPRDQRQRDCSDVTTPSPLQLSRQQYEELMAQLHRCYPLRMGTLGAALRASQSFNGSQQENAEKEKDVSVTLGAVRRREECKLLTPSLCLQLLLWAFASRPDPRRASVFHLDVARLAELVDIENGVEFIIPEGSNSAAPQPPAVVVPLPAPQSVVAPPAAQPAAPQLAGGIQPFVPAPAPRPPEDSESDSESDELSSTQVSSSMASSRRPVRRRTSAVKPGKPSAAPAVRAAAVKRQRRVAPTVAKRQAQALKKAALSAALQHAQQPASGSGGAGSATPDAEAAPMLPSNTSSVGEMMRILAAMGCGIGCAASLVDDDEPDIQGLTARDRRQLRNERKAEGYQRYTSDGTVNVKRAVGVLWKLSHAVLKKDQSQLHASTREVIKQELWLRSEGGPCSLERLIYFVLAAVHDRNEQLLSRFDNLLLSDDKIKVVANGLLKLVIGAGTLAILPVLAAASFRQTRLCQLSFTAHYKWLMRFNGSSYGTELDELRDTFLLPVLSKMHELLPQEWICLSERIKLSHHTVFGAAVVKGEMQSYAQEYQAWYNQEPGARKPLRPDHTPWRLYGVDAPNALYRPLVSHSAVAVLDGESALQLPYKHLGLDKVFNPETRPIEPLPFPERSTYKLSVRILVQHELVQPQQPPQPQPSSASQRMPPPAPPESTRASSPALSISESLASLARKRIGSSRLNPLFR
jgi:hypothetical protein